MIRINLLQQEERTQRRARVSINPGDLVIPVAVISAAGLIILGTSLSQGARVKALTEQVDDVEAQSRAIAPQIERVNRLARERAELDLRLGIISKLEKGRTQSVRLMDELARCVPDHLWLTVASQEAGNRLNLEGVTHSNLVVSDFMSRLEQSPLFSTVELAVAERGQVAQKDVVKFKIGCQITPDERAN